MPASSLQARGLHCLLVALLLLATAIPGALARPLGVQTQRQLMSTTCTDPTLGDCNADWPCDANECWTWYDDDTPIYACGESSSDDFDCSSCATSGDETWECKKLQIDCHTTGFLDLSCEYTTIHQCVLSTTCDSAGGWC